MRAEPILGVALAAAIALACAGEAPRAPAPLGVEPRVAYAGRSVPLRIRGDGFFPAARRHADGTGAVDAGFRAWLGETELEDVRWVDAVTLTAVAPSSLPPAVHALVVQDPRGVRSRAEAAFESFAERPPDLRARLSVDPPAPRAGETVTVALALENAGDAAALGVVPSASAAAADGPLALAGPAGPDAPPGDLAGGGALRFAWSFVAPRAGDVALAAAATGDDAHTGEPVAASTSSVVRVFEGPALAVSASVGPELARVGDTLTVSITLRNGGDVPLSAATAALAPRGTATLETLALPLPVDVGAAAEVTIAATYRATTAGTATFDVHVDALDAERLTPLSADAATGTSGVDRHALLTASATAPALVSTGQAFAVTLLVSNAGDAAASVTPSLAISTPAAAEILARPEPATVPSSTPDTPLPFTWMVRALAPGPLLFHAAVDGLEVNLAPLLVSVAGDASTRVERAAELAASAPSAPETVSTGQRFTVSAQARNAGGAAIDVVPELVLPGAFAEVIDAPAPRRIVGEDGGPAAPVTFSWTLRALSTGSGTLTFRFTGTDANDPTRVLGASVAAPSSTAAVAAADLVWRIELPAVVTEDQSFPVKLVVWNHGDAAAVLSPSAIAPLGATVVEPAQAAIVPGITSPGAAPVEVPFVWWLRAGAPGTIPPFELRVDGHDANDLDHLLEALGFTAGVEIQARPVLEIASLVASPATVNRGQTITVTMTVRNAGGAPLEDVTPGPLTASGASLVAAPSGPVPASYPAISSADPPSTFTWTVAAAATGSLSFGAGATGTDANSGALVAATDSSSNVLSVQAPAKLDATLVLTDPLPASGSFDAQLMLTNAGEANALDATPDAQLAVVAGSTAAVTLVASPAIAGVTLAKGAQAGPYVWTFRVDRGGTLQLRGGASATDGNDGAKRTVTVTSNATATLDPLALATNPFGDDTAYAQIAAYAGALYLGPSKDGTHIARLDPLGGSTPASLPVSIQYDYVATDPGSSMRNPYWETEWLAGRPVWSFGSALCDQTYKQTCGPDLENGYGTLLSGRFGTDEWLLVSGSQVSGLDYFYATRSTGPGTLEFGFLDLRPGLVNTAKRLGTAEVIGSRMYVGYVDQSTARPVVRALSKAPAFPLGIDAALGTDVVDLRADAMPHVGCGGSPPNAAANVGLDVIAEWGGRIYLANNGGVVRSTTDGTPRPYDVAPGDWADATPSAAAWTRWASVALPDVGDLRPFHRAVPAIAGFGGRLFLVRNVFGPGAKEAPELWRCRPALAAPVEHCDPDDWDLVAPNASGVTQLGPSVAEAATIAVATPRALYVGFDDARNGAQLFRTTDPDASGPAGWTQVGAPGLGDAANHRFIDAAVVVDAAGRSHLYVVVGDPTSSPPLPLRVYEIPD